MNTSPNDELTAALAELHSLFPDWRFGQFLANIVQAAAGRKPERFGILKTNSC